MEKMNCLQSVLRNWKLVKPFNCLGSQRFYSDQNVIDPPEEFFNIPKHKVRENESIDVQKARLLYQSRKRGMLENDLLLSTFAGKYLNNFTTEQTRDYDKLINGPSNDWDIYYWATNKKPIPQEYDNEVMDLFKQHCKNINKEQRIRQPDL